MEQLARHPTPDGPTLLGGVTALTVIHELTDAPNLGRLMSGEFEEMGAGVGWAWVLSDLKSLLETGSAFGD